jgi:hypothetical protein
VLAGLPNGLKLSRKAPSINALDQTTQGQAQPASAWLLLSRQRLWGLVGSNFELGTAHFAPFLCEDSRRYFLSSVSERAREFSLGIARVRLRVAKT